MKTEVYSWRLSSATKRVLELEARREGASVSALLDRIAAEWLSARRESGVTDAAEQARLHTAAERMLGTIRGRDADRADRARDDVRARLTRRRAR